MNGRDFEWRDNSRGLRVTILSQSLARRLFGDANPVGQRVRVGLDPSRDALEVIGVVADARLYDLKSPDVFAAYMPALQDQNASFKCFVIRGDNVSFASLKEAVESLGRERVGDVVTLQYITDRSLLLERLTALLSSFFGSLVLLLAGVGLFGLMSYAVAQRRREIGIRMALGADRRRVCTGRRPRRLDGHAGWSRRRCRCRARHRAGRRDVTLRRDTSGPAHARRGRGIPDCDCDSRLLRPGVKGRAR